MNDDRFLGFLWGLLGGMALESMFYSVSPLGFILFALAVLGCWFFREKVV